MIINYRITKKEIIEIWPLDEVKNYLRITHDYDDQLIESLTESSIESAEQFTGLSLFRRYITCNIMIAKKAIDLKYTPVLDIVKISQISVGKNEEIIGDFGYIESDNNRLHLESKYVGKELEIEYVSGYSENIPRAIQHGILMHIASMYEHEENRTNINSQIKDLYIPYRMMKI